MDPILFLDYGKSLASYTEKKILEKFPLAATIKEM